MFLLIYVLYQSRWLLAHDCREQAIEILRKTHHPSEVETVMLTVTEIEEQIGTHRTPPTAVAVAVAAL